MFRTFRRTLRGWSFPVIGWLSVGIYLVVAAGLPLPFSGAITKDLSLPFPCMHSPCGCHNAEQCWKSCCCHTPAERLAWAREHGVTPSPSLIVEVEVSPAIQPAASCCNQAAPKTCCATKPTKSSCCTSPDGSGHSAPDVVKNQPTGSSMVFGIHAMSCHGFDTDWLASLIALSPAIVGREYRPLPSGSIFVSANDISSTAFPPPVPPPRIAAI